MREIQWDETIEGEKEKERRREKEREMCVKKNYSELQRFQVLRCALPWGDSQTFWIQVEKLSSIFTVDAHS